MLLFGRLSRALARAEVLLVAKLRPEDLTDLLLETTRRAARRIFLRQVHWFPHGFDHRAHGASARIVGPQLSADVKHDFVRIRARADLRTAAIDIATERNASDLPPNLLA